jgi:RNA polymerase sigma-70 factor, ECF subfamily
VVALDPPALAAARGSRPDFDAVYREYLPKLTRYIAANTPRDAVQSPEDLAHDALLKAWRTWDQHDYRGPGALHAWLFTIALNVVRDEYRHRQLVRFRPLDASPAAWRLTSDDPRGEPEDSLLHQERAAESRHALQRALPTLTPRQRLVVLGHFHFGLSLDETADALGTTRGACKSAIYHARARLAATLGARPDVRRIPAPRRRLALALKGRHTATDAARLTGLSQSTVTRIWKENDA